MLYHSVSFDLHVHDLWGPWCHGGSVVVVPVPIADVAGVWRCGRDASVTHLSMTPFGFQMFTTAHLRLKQSKVDAYAHLKSVMLCGEALDFSTVAHWVTPDEERGNVVPVIVNSYGITETTVVNTFIEVTQNKLSWPSSIGRRLPHTVMLLLNESLECVKHGERGELYLTGDCLASGYITSVEKNDTSFLSLPARLAGGVEVVAPSMSHHVMYKTGDIALFDDSRGGFVFCGRCDAEIKCGGFRIHPMEVEEQLQKLAALVREAVVVPTKHSDGRTVLFAFVIPQAASVTKSELRSALRELVADYKVPAFFQLLPLHYRFPVTASNKVDRVSLKTWAAKHAVLPPDTRPTYLPGEQDPMCAV